MSVEVLKPVPVQKLEPAWIDVFEVLQEPPTIGVGVAKEDLKNWKPTPAQINDAIRLAITWNITLHWVVKLKWDSKHKIPYPAKVKRVIEPFGKLIYRYLELCIQCHSCLPLGQTRYENAAMWFWKIVRESQRNTIFRESNIGKTETLNQRRATVNAFVDLTNPIPKQDAPYEWDLIETAIKVVNLSDRFETEYWTPFIRDYRSWNTAVDGTDWGATYQEVDKLYVQAEQGKGRLLLDFQKLMAETLTG